MFVSDLQVRFEIEGDPLTGCVCEARGDAESEARDRGGEEGFGV